MSGDNQITKKQIIQQFTGESPQQDVGAGVDFVISQIGINRRRIRDDSVKRLTVLISALRTKNNEKWRSAQRKVDRYEEHNKAWLDSAFLVPEMETSDTSSTSSSRASEIEELPEAEQSETEPGPSLGYSVGRGRGRGRPALPYEDLSLRSRRQDASTISEQFPGTPRRLVSAAAHAARATGRQDLAKVLQIAMQSPRAVASARRSLFERQPNQIRKYTPVEALSLLLENNFSKSQYLAISKGASQRGVNLYPGYNRLVQEKKECRPPPEELFIDERKAEVLLQSLLNHTVTRIVKLQEEAIAQYLSNHPGHHEIQLISAWGCDGSSDHSIYKNKSKTEFSDASLFATTMTPLRLQLNGPDGETVILWNNSTPQSPRFCRPIRLQFQAESKELVLGEIDKMEREIGTLEPHIVRLEGIGQEVKISFAMFMTMIDGKILNFKTGTSSQCCPICNAKPKQFNDLRNLSTSVFTPNPNSLQHGISPLHAWIRLLECCLHISYRLGLNPPVWRVPGGQKNPQLIRRKREIQKRLQDELQIRVDFVKQGAGTSNDGNTARIAFRNWDKFANILGLDETLVKNFRTILVAISCQLPIDPVHFGTLCKDTAELYVKKYSWYPMPPTVHKILVHGAQIISNSVLPVGMLGEDAQEARNKFYRKFRLELARKTSRRDNMEDMYLRTMDTSDPILSSIDLAMRLRKRQRFRIPREVLQLLAQPEPPPSGHAEVEIEEDEHEDGDEKEDFSCFSDVTTLLNEIELEEEDEGLDDEN